MVLKSRTIFSQYSGREPRRWSTSKTDPSRSPRLPNKSHSNTPGPSYPRANPLESSSTSPEQPVFTPKPWPFPDGALPPFSFRSSVFPPATSSPSAPPGPASSPSFLPQVQHLPMLRYSSHGSNGNYELRNINSILSKMWMNLNSDLAKLWLI